MPGQLGNLRRVSWRAALVWRRDLLACWGTRPARVLPRLLEPLLFLAAAGAGLGGLVGDVVDQGVRLGYLEFVAPGLLAGAVMLISLRATLDGAFFRMIEGTTFEAALAAPLSLEDVVAGEILWGTTRSFLPACVLLAAMSAAGVARWPTSWWVAPVALLGGLFFACAGMCLAAVCPKAASFELPRVLVVLPMLLFSGTLFPAESLPGWASRAVWVSPLTHVASLVRAASLGRTPPHLAASLGVLVGASAVLFVLALVLMRRRLAR
jgi:lipooligosaccharide transport system permease protein